MVTTAGVAGTARAGADVAMSDRTARAPASVFRNMFRLLYARLIKKGLSRPERFPRRGPWLSACPAPPPEARAVGRSPGLQKPVRAAGTPGRGAPAGRPTRAFPPRRS